MKNKTLLIYSVGLVMIFGIFSIKPPHLVSHGKVVGARTDSIPVYNNLQGWQYRLNSLGYIVSVIKKSDIPSRDATFIIDSLLAPFQSDIVNQVSNYVRADTATKKPVTNKTK